MVPVLKYVRGEHLSQDHWLDMFRLLGLPRGTTLERLTFNDLLGVANTIIEKALELKVCTHTRTHTLIGIYRYRTMIDKMYELLWLLSLPQYVTRTTRGQQQARNSTCISTGRAHHTAIDIFTYSI